MWLCYHLRVTDIHKYVNRCVLSVYAKYIYLHILLLPPILWVKKERLLLFSSHSLLEIQVSNLKRVTSPYWLLFSPSLPPCKKQENRSKTELLMLNCMPPNWDFIIVSALPEMESEISQSGVTWSALVKSSPWWTPTGKESNLEITNPLFWASVTAMFPLSSA